MSIITHPRGAGQSRRTPIRTYHPENAPRITAAVTYHDPALGTVAHSVRSNLGVMGASTAIHWDVGVFNRLVADGCQWLECHIKNTGQTYRCHVDTMLAHGQQQQRFGLQWVLHLKYWSVDGQPAEFERQIQQQAQPASARPEQPALFDLTDKRTVYR